MLFQVYKFFIYLSGIYANNDLKTNIVSQQDFLFPFKNNSEIKKYLERKNLVIELNLKIKENLLKK